MFEIIKAFIDFQSIIFFFCKENNFNREKNLKLIKGKGHLIKYTLLLFSCIHLFPQVQDYL